MLQHLEKGKQIIATGHPQCSQRSSLSVWDVRRGLKVVVRHSPAEQTPYARQPKIQIELWVGSLAVEVPCTMPMGSTGHHEMKSVVS